MYQIPICCFQWLKVTKMKANHNVGRWLVCPLPAVSNGSKLLKWKQITTVWCFWSLYYGCFQWLKVTKMKANHNCNRIEPKRREAVSNGPKLLKWKQVTIKYCKILGQLHQKVSHSLLCHQNISFSVILLKMETFSW